MKPWQLVNWPPVKAHVTEWLNGNDRARHLATTTLSSSGWSPNSPTYGQVAWGWDVMDQDAEISRTVAAAWDWCAVKPGVIVLADPMTLITNLVLVDATGFPITEDEKLLQLHLAIMQLDWQKMVLTQAHDELRPTLELH
jgi:hypothetical protein